jgi:hypothetical protein
MAQAVFTHRPAATGIRDYTHTHRDIGGGAFPEGPKPFYAHIPVGHFYTVLPFHI